MAKSKTIQALPVRAPYLVQRCSVKTGFHSGLKTGDYLKLDYMGSSEFEWGAIPKFQREILPKLALLKQGVVVHGGYTLYFLAPLDQHTDYAQILKDLIDRKTRTKESLHMDFKETIYVGKKQTPMYDQPHAPYSVTVWFDLDNQLIFARDPKVLENLLITIPNSVRFMDAQKGA